MPLIAFARAFAFLLVAASHAATPWGAKEWGVLLIAADGAQSDKQALKKLTSDLRPRFPLETASGLADVREIQRGFDRLSAAQAKKIVVVPLALATDSQAMEETKYILGLRRDPSPDFFRTGRNHAGYDVIRRAQTKLPVVLTSALDEHSTVTEILVQRARELSRDPRKERLVLVGREAGTPAEDDLSRRRVRLLALRIQSAVGFAAAEGALLSSLDASGPQRAASEKRLRDMVAAYSRQGHTIVLPYLLVQDGTERRIRAVLDGLFYAWKGEALMPNPLIGQWVEAKAREAAALPDMRRFTDTGRKLPPPETKRMLRSAQ